MYTRLSLEVVQCRQFDPVSGPFSMNNERKDETPSVYTIGSQKDLVPVNSRHAYFKRRSRVPRLTLLILILVVASLSIVVIVLSILYAMAGRRATKLCDSEDCVRIAASLKESMDTSVDPCDDFYTYACGRWTSEHPIPESSLTNSWFSERTKRMSRRIRDLLKANVSKDGAPWAVEQAKILYDSCMDEDAMNELGLTSLFQLLEAMKLPSIPAAFTDEPMGNYVEQMAMVRRILGRDIFVGFEVLPDPRNKSINILFLDVPSTHSPFPTDKEIEKRIQAVRTRLRRLRENPQEVADTDDEDEAAELAEIDYMTDVLKEVLSNGTFDVCSLTNDSFPNEEKLDEIVNTLYATSSVVYYLAQAESNYSVAEEDLSDEHYMLVDDLQRITDEYITEVNSTLVPKLLWRPFIEVVFDGIVKLDLDGRDRVLVANLEYLKDVAFLLAHIEEASVETYIWWVVIDMIVPHSSENLRKIWTHYVDQIMSVEVNEPKSLYCAGATNELMGMAVSWLFVDRNFHANQGPKVTEMLTNIRTAFSTLVRETDWMDDATKRATLEKNNKMGSEIGHPKWLFNEEDLNEYYEGIDLSETKYLDNMVQIVQCMTFVELDSFHGLNNYDNESFWATDPTDVNAFHTYQVNQITIPAGILQFPFYELGLEALNYGAIGTVLGHELTHGFDNSGRQYDSEGNLRQWWTNETIYEYTDRTKCFVDHYSSYYEEEVEDYIDGELTLGENIADNGGLREAYLAYGLWRAKHGQEPLLPGFTHLTHDQLLFLSFAHLWCESYTAQGLKWMLQDSHCPGHVRPQAVLRNSKEFSEAWKCPVGSKMNPTAKCRLW